MPTYSLNAINVGSFALGETDKVITLFSAERGLVKAVAKGARKPGSKIAGRADVLNVNRLLMATGKTFEIISQCESVETFPSLRKDLSRLSFALYYAELTHHFGQGLEDDSRGYFEFLVAALKKQAEGADQPAMLCLSFEMQLIDRLGLLPEIDYCVICREPLTDHKIALFHFELGGIICSDCARLDIGNIVSEEHALYGNGPSSRASRKHGSGGHEPGGESGERGPGGESGQPGSGEQGLYGRGLERYRSGGYGLYRHGPSGQRSPGSVHITPLVWKRLVLAKDVNAALGQPLPAAIVAANVAARRVIQSYIEYKAGKRMKSLDLLGKI